MSDELEYGPAYAVLTDRQKRFVLAMASDPFGTQGGWAKAAGYENSVNGLRVRGHLLAHDPRIEAASLEVARAMMSTVGPLIAANAMIRAARDPNDKNHLRAVEMLANRVGMNEVQEVHVRHTDETVAAKIERIRELAALLGVDPVALIGANAPAALPAPVEVNPVSRETQNPT